MSDYIKREDAINAVKRLSNNYSGKGKKEWHPHIDFIVDELKYEIPSADVVEYEIADNTTMIIKSDKWENIGRVILTNNDTKFCKVLYVDEERKRGEWIKTDRTYYGATVYECSACCDEVDEMPTVMGEPRYNYCPSCGADMREREGE